ncbi:unnamed protein product [Gordionus sp. m RMFG-2023]|uniref:protein LSM12 homolog B-like isoform X2 n=1 Tax=Gordionus sp. m RMFG-2023 TaxID=3053472 RepID=UPI0030E4A433
MDNNNNKSHNFKCTTISGKKFEGEIIGFDEKKNYIILKSDGSKPGLNNLHIINLNGAIYESIPALKPDPLPIIDLDKNYVKNKDKHILKNVTKDVTPIGKSLFVEISKTLKVSWNGAEIRVMDDVVILPPYQLDNCSGGETVLLHVKKILEKHHEKYNQNIRKSIKT